MEKNGRIILITSDFEGVKMLLRIIEERFNSPGPHELLQFLIAPPESELTDERESRCAQHVIYEIFSKFSAPLKSTGFTLTEVQK